ncbi:MAG TPA: hypothetical protein PK306_22370 [Aquabacterium sp.]|nr:hypothetical protein [Aquabacterium sp.]HQC98450.1 hypothetical protein [Aquabacterium sp.]
MGTTLSRLQLAQRIHKLLVKEIEHAIEVERLLADPRYARDVLLVCEAVPGGELGALAALFREASAGQPGVPGHAAQANDWGRDTSGFGMTQPPSLAGPMPRTASLHQASRRAGDSEPAPLAPARPSWLPRWRSPK